MKFFAIAFVLLLVGCVQTTNREVLSPALEEGMDTMKNFPCHQMGGMWMGQCEKDADGNVIPPESGETQEMEHHNSDEKFSEDATNLPEVVPTKIVTLKDGDTFEMTAEMVQQEVGNRTIKRLAYNRMIPGPIIQVEKNAKINLQLTNKLDVNTTLHSHGLRLADDTFDGLPDTMGGKQSEMKPGDSFAYELNFPDAGVFWYHPHIREDYTQEMGLYGNYHVTEEDYWNDVTREEFLVLDDFAEADPFYKDKTNKTLMGRFGNLLLINNDENFSVEVNQGETTRFYVTNTANTRTFDFEIEGQELTIVGGDIGRIEKEFNTYDFIIAPAERIIFETRFDKPGVYEIQHRDKKIGEINVVESSVGAEYLLPNETQELRENLEDYAMIRDDFQKYLDQESDKKLRIDIQIEGMKMGRMMDHGEVRGDGIEWEDDMAAMNQMSDSKTVKWLLIDEETEQENMDINWVFKKDDLIKIEIFNDPKSMHPMQHPIHFHGQRFVVISRDGKPVDNLQWKDTTLVRNGERIEILLNTTNPGKWMSHCHIAEHLHSGMMFNFEVE